MHPRRGIFLGWGRSVDKAYLITRELNEKKGYTHH